MSQEVPEVSQEVPEVSQEVPEVSEEVPEVSQKVPEASGEVPTNAPEASMRQVQDVQSEVSTPLVGVKKSKTPICINLKLREVRFSYDSILVLFFDVSNILLVI